jgi:peptidoglycan-N-acetylglucosamine deacetylase
LIVPLARIVLWVASIGALALLARSLMVGPVPTWIAVLYLVVYLAYCTAGSLVPQLEMYGDALWRGLPGWRHVALTFDDGPHPDSTRRVLEILGRTGHKATFFVVGRKAAAHPDVVAEIHAQGHAIGLHGYAHERLYSFKHPKLVEEDIRRSQDVIEGICGLRPALFRPPLGYMTPRTVVGARRAGVELIAWSVRSIDGLGATDPDRVASRVERGLHDGAIVAMHDAAERDDFEPASIAALPRIVRALEQRGLTSVRVDQLARELAQGSPHQQAT